MKTTDLVELRAELQRKIEAIDLILGHEVPTPKKRMGRPPGTGKSTPKGKRRMSAAGRAKIAAAAKARWAKIKAAGKSHL